MTRRTSSTIGISGALALLLAGPAAADGLTGYGGLFVGGEQIHSFVGGSTERAVPNGGALIGANMPFGGGWNAGIDGFGGATAQDNTDYFNAWGGGSLHIFHRDADYAVGVFGTAAALMKGDEGITVAGGAEAAFFSADSTLVLQGGYLSRMSGVLGTESDNDLISHGLALRAQNRWFFDDDMRFDAGVIGIWGQVDSAQNELGGGGFEVEFEHKPEGWPVSYFVGGTALAGHEEESGGSIDISLYYTVGLGIRLYFGHETLKSNDRGGVTFKSLPVKDIQRLAGDL